MEPTATAIGTWSGGRFMHFGEPLAEERLEALLRPAEGLRTVLTADVYGEGEADRTLGRALKGLARESYCLVGAIGHDFYEGERAGPKGYPRFTDARLRGQSQYGDYIRMATERSLERCGVESFDVLLLHNPDRTGYRSEAVWAGIEAVREEGLTRLVGVAPGPANGFTLDVIECFERFGEQIDWAMIILGPMEPWPGTLVLEAAREHGVKLITRVVDYGGLFHDCVSAEEDFAEHDHRRFRPAGWVRAGLQKLESMRPMARARGLTLLQLACAWNLSQAPVACVAPTLIQERGDESRAIEDERAELIAFGRAPVRLSEEDVQAVREIGENRGTMALKGASSEHEGPAAADRWELDEHSSAVAARWRIDPSRDLARDALARA